MPDEAIKFWRICAIWDITEGCYLPADVYLDVPCGKPGRPKQREGYHAGKRNKEKIKGYARKGSCLAGPLFISFRKVRPRKQINGRTHGGRRGAPKNSPLQAALYGRILFIYEGN